MAPETKEKLLNATAVIGSWAIVILVPWILIYGIYRAIEMGQ